MKGKVVLTVLGLASLASKSMASQHSEDQKRFIKIPRFIQLESSNNGEQTVDLLEVLNESEEKFIEVIKDSNLLDKGFHNEENDNDFSDFYSDIITVPLDLFTHFPFNVDGL